MKPIKMAKCFTNFIGILPCFKVVLNQQRVEADSAYLQSLGRQSFVIVELWLKCYTLSFFNVKTSCGAPWLLFFQSILNLWNRTKEQVTLCRTLFFFNIWGKIVVLHWYVTLFSTDHKWNLIRIFHWVKNLFENCLKMENTQLKWGDYFHSISDVGGWRWPKKWLLAAFMASIRWLLSQGPLS